MPHVCSLGGGLFSSSRVINSIQESYSEQYAKQYPDPELARQMQGY